MIKVSDPKLVKWITKTKHDPIKKKCLAMKIKCGGNRIYKHSHLWSTYIKLLNIRLSNHKIKNKMKTKQNNYRAKYHLMSAHFWFFFSSSFIKIKCWFFGIENMNEWKINDEMIMFISSTEKKKFFFLIILIRIVLFEWIKKNKRKRNNKMKKKRNEISAT